MICPWRSDESIADVIQWLKYIWCGFGPVPFLYPSVEGGRYPASQHACMGQQILAWNFGKQLPLARCTLALLGVNWATDSLLALQCLIRFMHAGPVGRTDGQNGQNEWMDPLECGNRRVLALILPLFQ